MSYTRHFDANGRDLGWIPEMGKLTLPQPPLPPGAKTPPPALKGSFSNDNPAGKWPNKFTADPKVVESFLGRSSAATGGGVPA